MAHDGHDADPLGELEARLDVLALAYSRFEEAALAASRVAPEEAGAIIESLRSRLRSTGSLDRPRRQPQTAHFETPDDADVLMAMYDAGGLDRPVSASEIACALWHGEHGHSEVVRLGLRLRLLAYLGRVVRHPRGSHRANRWQLKGATDAR